MRVVVTPLVQVAQSPHLRDQLCQVIDVDEDSIALALPIVTVRSRSSTALREDLRDVRPYFVITLIEVRDELCASCAPLVQLTINLLQTS